MKRKGTAWIVCICLIIACTACRETPERDVIVNKEGQSNLISNHAQADQGIFLREQVQAPEHVEAEGKSGNEYTTIKIDANVEVPEKSSIPVYSYTTKHYTEEELESLAKILFPDGEIRNWEPNDSQMTEEELNRNIEELQEAMDEMVISDIPEPIWDEDANLIEGNQALYDYWTQEKQEFEQQLATLQEHKTNTNISYTYSELSDNYIFQVEFDDAVWEKDAHKGRSYDAETKRLEYTYQSIGLQGMRNGRTYDMKLDDDGSNTVLYYAVDRMETLKNGSSLYNMDVVTSDHSSYGNENVCQYTAEEAGKLVTDLLSELGYDDFQVGYLYDMTTSFYKDRASVATESDRIMNGYGLFLYRGIDGMSEVYEVTRDTNSYHQFMGFAQLPFNSINTMYSVEEYMMNIAGAEEPGRYKEIVFANVLDDGVVQLVIINPMLEQELLAEHVELIDFEQVLQQGISYMETKYGNQGGSSYPYSVQVKSIQLNYAYMQSPDNPEEYMLIPVWDFRSDSNGEIYATINAIDGTVFERIGLY